MALAKLTIRHAHKSTRLSAAEFARLSRAPKLRTMREFAEQEIYIPDGPFEGHRFNCERQPYSGLYFDLVDSGRWNRIFATGPTQSGKSLTAFVIPALYHLFEYGDTVICALPDMDMAGDKWREDLLPVISRTRYRELMPTRGGGSRGGKVESLQFKNGATLKFMSGGGGDKSRAGFTARVVVGTEVDGLDETGGTSVEADKWAQVEARTRAYGARKRVYGECTVSVEQGRTWREFSSGTATQLFLRCPLCGSWVLPERSSLVGWEDADDEVEARSRGCFGCPACGGKWTDDDRRVACRRLLPVHRGQEITAGGVLGELPKTQTLGFRWSAVHNLFASQGDIAVDEWKARHTADGDEDNRERELQQFVWARPYRPPITDLTPLDKVAIQKRRAAGWTKGVVPAATTALTMGLDVGKWQCHWVLLAAHGENRFHVVDYGAFEVHSHDMAEELAILTALREWNEVVSEGWQQNNERVAPGLVFIDSGYHSEVVYRLCRELGARWCPVKGHSETRRWGFDGRYVAPSKKTRAIRQIGQGWHSTRLQKGRIELYHLDVDFWKQWVQRRLSTPPEEPGALTLYETNEKWHHMRLAESLTAEKQTSEWVAGRGEVVRWQVVKQNKSHWFDALGYAAAAASRLGASVVGDEVDPGRAGNSGGWFVNQVRK